MYKSLKRTNDKLDRTVYVQMGLALIQEEALELHTKLRNVKIEVEVIENKSRKHLLIINVYKRVFFYVINIHI